MQMHRTTVQIPAHLRDFIEDFCFERGLSFAAWVRTKIAEEQDKEKRRQQDAADKRDRR